MQPDCMADERTAPQAGSVLQLKAGLLGISPMIRRRILVPGTMSLHGLHGALQVAMGWEGIHLFEFNIRGVVHAGPCLPGPAGVDTPMSDLRLQRNGKLRCIHDMNCRWDHELRVEDRTSAVPGKRYPVCIGGSRACPPEDCGGVEGYFAGRDEAAGPAAMKDLRLLADFVERTLIGKDLSMVEDEDSFRRVETASERCRSRARLLADRFCRGTVNRRFRAGEHLQFMHRQATLA